MLPSLISQRTLSRLRLGSSAQGVGQHGRQQADMEIVPTVCLYMILATDPQCHVESEAVV